MNVKNFRAPAVPLITHDPLFSVWSEADRLTDDVTRHWDGVRQYMFGLLVVDSHIFEFLGKLNAIDERKVTRYPVLRQKSCEIRPMTTAYTFGNEQLTLQLRFTSPLLLNDLTLLARPLTYIDYSLQFLDGKKHDVHVIFGFSGEFCVNTNDQKVAVGLTPYSIYFTAGTENMLKDSGDDHRISWGSFHAVAPGYFMEAMGLVRFWDRLKARYSSYRVPVNVLPNLSPNLETAGPSEYAVNKKTPVCPEYPTILVRKEWTQTEQISDGIAVAYDDVKALQYFGETVDAYYKKDGDDFGRMVRRALDEHGEVLTKVKKFEDELLKKARRISPKYADILSLAYRQAVAGHKLCMHNGELLFVSKENHSNGSAATVDVTYPSLPLFLLYEPRLAEGMLNPIFKMLEKGLWLQEYAPHDAGTYPLVNGQTYGYIFRHRKHEPDPANSQMPVEECGNMLLCVAAICAAEKKYDYFRDHEPVLRQWAEYLVRTGIDPERQLCTDDFEGHLAHNCNLAVKTVCALGAYAKTAAAAGFDYAAYYEKTAREFAAQWVKRADDGDWYRLTFDGEGTWSLKYNMVWDRLLKLDLFPRKVYDAELVCYKARMNPYGIPLDCRGVSAKTDWEMWTTALFDDKEYTDMIVDRMWKFLCDCEDRVPFGDLIFTTKPWIREFTARTVQGGLFMPLLKL